MTTDLGTLCNELNQAKAKVKMHTAMIAVANSYDDDDEAINQQANATEWHEHVAYLIDRIQQIVRISKNATSGVTQTP